VSCRDSTRIERAAIGWKRPQNLISAADGRRSEISRQGAKNAKEYENGLSDTAAISQVAALPSASGSGLVLILVLNFLAALASWRLFLSFIGVYLRLNSVLDFSDRF
jgi:hypothetical protein